MDRQIVYPGAIPLDTDILSVQRNMMVALGFLAQATLGTGTIVDGLACTQTTVASMIVNVGPGSIVSLSTVDASAFGSLAADSTDNLVKMGANLATTPFALTAPVVAGQSINYLIEASFLESDASAVVLPYYNASNPAMPYSGPANSGAAQNTQRLQRVQLQLKAGASASTGTQATPSVDSGWVGLWVITVNYGMSSVTNAAISVCPGAPFIPAKLPLTRGNNIAKFTASGSWTVPTGVVSVKARGWGAGGGGGGMGNAGVGGGGGGQGGAYFEGIATVTPGAVITYTVGASGAGGTNVSGSYNGSTGGTTSFGTFATATGGSGGAGFANGTGGGGYGNGVATGGTLNITGTSGQNGISVSTAFLGGVGGSTFGTGSTFNGSGGGPTGNFPGGGGGGGTQNSAGGAGGAGLLILEW